MKLVVVDENKGTNKARFKDGLSFRVENEPIILDKDDMRVQGNSKWKNSIEDKYKSLEEGWGEWVRYKLNNKKPIKNQNDKENYSYYCCGYLFYYDEIVRSGAINHEVYFYWPTDNEVVIFINPGPDRSKSTYSKLHAGFDASKDYLREGTDEYLVPALSGIDPTPPPPPPPPPNMS